MCGAAFIDIFHNDAKRTYEREFQEDLDIFRNSKSKAKEKEVKNILRKEDKKDGFFLRGSKEDCSTLYLEIAALSYKNINTKHKLKILTNLSKDYNLS